MFLLGTLVTSKRILKITPRGHFGTVKDIRGMEEKKGKMVKKRKQLEMYPSLQKLVKKIQSSPKMDKS